MTDPENPNTMQRATLMRASEQAKQRIVFVHNSADQYGASRSLLRLASALALRQHEVHVVVPEAGSLVDLLRPIVAGVHVVPSLAVLERNQLRSPLGLLAHAWKAVYGTAQCVRLMRKLQPTVVHTNLALVYSGALAARLLGIPHVWHVRENLELDAGARALLWLIPRLSARIIAISSFVGSQFPERCRAKVTRVFNGLPDAEFESVAEVDQRRLAEAHGLRDDRFVITCVGRLKLKRKGQETLIEAMARLRHAHGPGKFICLMVGEAAPGNERHSIALRQLVTELQLDDEVLFVGQVADARPYYAVSDVVVMPSAVAEPFGNVVVEAMALGKPAVATALGGPIDQIRPGVDGLLFAPGDAHDLAAALERLYADPSLLERLGAEARRTAWARFRISATADAVEAAYGAVVAQTRQTAQEGVG